MVHGDEGGRQGDRSPVAQDRQCCQCDEEIHVTVNLPAMTGQKIDADGRKDCGKRRAGEAGSLVVAASDGHPGRRDIRGQNESYRERGFASLEIERHPDKPHRPEPCREHKDQDAACAQPIKFGHVTSPNPEQPDGGAAKSNVGIPSSLRDITARSPSTTNEPSRGPEPTRRIPSCAMAVSRSMSPAPGRGTTRTFPL